MHWGVYNWDGVFISGVGVFINGVGVYVSGVGVYVSGGGEVFISGGGGCGAGCISGAGWRGVY